MFKATIALFSVATVSALSAQDYMSQLNKRPLSELAQSEVDAKAGADLEAEMQSLMNPEELAESKARVQEHEKFLQDFEVSHAKAVAMMLA